MKGEISEGKRWGPRHWVRDQKKRGRYINESEKGRFDRAGEEGMTGTPGGEWATQTPYHDLKDVSNVTTGIGGGMGWGVERA